MVKSAIETGTLSRRHKKFIAECQRRLGQEFTCRRCTVPNGHLHFTLSAGLCEMSCAMHDPVQCLFGRCAECSKSGRQYCRRGFHRPLEDDPLNAPPQPQRGDAPLDAAAKMDEYRFPIHRLVSTVEDTYETSLVAYAIPLDRLDSKRFLDAPKHIRRMNAPSTLWPAPGKPGIDAGKITLDVLFNADRMQKATVVYAGSAPLF